MIINLTTIPEGTRHFQFLLEELWWHPEREGDQILAIDTPVQANLAIYKAGDKYVLDGTLQGGLQVICDRCVEAYHWELKTAFRVFLALPPPAADQAEVELLDQDMEVDFIQGEEIDLGEIIREQIYLSLPMKSLCKDECKGLCPVCGGNLNRGSCGCPREQGHPAFLRLRNLKFGGE